MPVHQGNEFYLFRNASFRTCGSPGLFVCYQIKNTLKRKALQDILNNCCFCLKAWGKKDLLDKILKLEFIASSNPKKLLLLFINLSLCWATVDVYCSSASPGSVYSYAVAVVLYGSICSRVSSALLKLCDPQPCGRDHEAEDCWEGCKRSRV